MSAKTHNRLTLTLPSDTEIVMTRVFDAPRRLVFEAHSKCEHVQHWWGRRVDSMTSCKMDFRPGGAWRYVLRDDTGQEYAFSGEFHEIVAPERFVWTFTYEGAPGEPCVEEYRFVERDGRTTLTSRGVFASKADRDAMIQTGMETGAAEMWDRLAEYLPTLRAAAQGS